MEDRTFSELDLRTMLENAQGCRRDEVVGRWIVEARFRRADWEVIVEPDDEERRVAVVTAYEVFEP